MASSATPRETDPAGMIDLANTQATLVADEAESQARRSAEPEIMTVNSDNEDQGSGNDRIEVRTPEPQSAQNHGASQGQHPHNGGQATQWPNTPETLAQFDWDDFQARFAEALAEADRDEHALQDEFDKLSKYFSIWASAASVHDNERAVKRLQTRERFVKLEEQSLAQKKQHLKEVVRAFQSAMALLSDH